jgi:hypothetical protein
MATGNELLLTEDQHSELRAIDQSRCLPAGYVFRAKLMLLLAEGASYCAEQFENDGSMSSSVLKTLKRSMATEYRRELSLKVFSGQCRLIEMGFRQGGPAGYGLRRQLIDRDRNPKGLLGRGERKTLQTDRVILVPWAGVIN